MALLTNEEIAGDLKLWEGTEPVEVPRLYLREMLEEIQILRKIAGEARAMLKMQEEKARNKDEVARVICLGMSLRVLTDFYAKGGGDDQTNDG